MTHTPPPDDDRVTRAWTAFARLDAKLRPSPALDRRVLAAARARTPTSPPSAGRFAAGHHWWALAACLAAVLVATLVAARWTSPVAPLASPAGAVMVSAAPPLIPPPSAVAEAAPAAVPHHRERRPAPPRARPVAAPVAGDSPAGDADGPWQVIRVRVQASALDAFGVQLAGPALAGLVDVDLVVGADGWPRDVRRIRPVPAIDRPE